MARKLLKKNYRGTQIVISHEHDLLNNVVTGILHLQDGKLTLYPGGYDAFEVQRAERAAQLAAAKAAQDAQRARLQEYVARNSARASTAKQAQSRAKMLAKMQPIAALMEDPSLSFDFPNPDVMRPPLITLDLAAVGYGASPILQRLNLRIDPDDRIALLGRNGNGKTTLVRLLAAQLAPMDGAMRASGKMRIGYFTQYQVEELSSDGTPLEHMTRAMEQASPGAVRARLGRFGFSGHKATTKIGKLSGGERARLALALITRDAPHLLILDEPTNHLDVDAREALVQALNAFEGAVILISHDRHMVELTADRLVLVDGGTASEYPGSIEDYIDFVLGRNQRKDRAPKSKKDRRVSAEAREGERKPGESGGLIGHANPAQRLQAQAALRVGSRGAGGGARDGTVSPPLSLRPLRGFPFDQPSQGQARAASRRPLRSNAIAAAVGRRIQSSAGPRAGEVAIGTRARDLAIFDDFFTVGSRGRSRSKSHEGGVRQ